MHLPPITDGEKPFNIPDSWEWVRIGKLATILNGDRGRNYPSKAHWVSEGVPFINAGSLSNGPLTSERFNYITQERFKLLRAGLIEI